MPLNHTSQYAQLTDRQFELLGRVVVEWASLEFLLGRLLNRLLHTPQFLGRTYADQLTSSRIEIAIREAIEIQRIRYGSRIVSEASQATTLSLLAEVQGKRALRNKIATSVGAAVLMTRFSAHRSPAGHEAQSNTNVPTLPLRQPNWWRLINRSQVSSIDCRISCP